jgi:hypothetical protein
MATSVFASACRHVNLAKTVSGSSQRESSRPQNQEPILENIRAFEKLCGRWRWFDADMHLQVGYNLFTLFVHVLDEGAGTIALFIHR